MINKGSKENSEVISIPVFDKQPFRLYNNISLELFIKELICMGKVIETSLVGDFDKENIERGSRANVELPFHKDGEYSNKKALEKGLPLVPNIDVVGLYCINGGETITSLKYLDISGNEKEIDFALNRGQGLIIDNNKVLHARKGLVTNGRLLFRIWLSCLDNYEEDLFCKFI